MNLLCFDVSGPHASIATFKAGVCQVFKKLDDRKAQAALLIPLIEEALTEAHLSYKDLEAIVTCRGPGSFTGIRIGLATAIGFSIALKIPLLALSAFEVAHALCLKQIKKQEAPILVVLDAFRNDFFCQFFPFAEKSFSPVNIFLSEIPTYTAEEPFILAGNVIPRILDDPTLPTSLILQTCITDFKAQDLGEYVLGMSIQDRMRHSSRALEPFYLRAPDITRAL